MGFIPGAVVSGLKRAGAALMLASLLVILPAAAQAQGGPPERVPAPDVNATVPAGALCPFEVTVSTVLNRGTETLFFDDSGNLTRVKVAGQLDLQIANDDTGASQVVHVSGPVTVTPMQDGSSQVAAHGPQLLPLFPGDDGGPGLSATTGLLTLRVEPDGTQSDVQMNGSQTDLCAALSS